MGKELHVGAGLLVLAATCGRVVMTNGDVVARGSGRLLQHADDVVGHGDALRHLDLAADLRHAEGPTSTLAKELLKEGAEFTAEQLLEWEPGLGEVDDTDFGGRWEGRWTLGDVSIESFCVRADLGDGTALTIRCKETGRRAGRVAYLADWEGRQAIGRAQVCTFTERIHGLDIRDEHVRGVLESDFAQRLANATPCAERILGHPLAVRVGDRVRVEKRP